MMSKAKIILITVSLWLMCCTYAAYHYVTSVLALPDISPGYESEWQFQLLAFAFVRFPFWILGLIAVLFLEFLVLKKPHKD
jgi:hypothetical protein